MQKIVQKRTELLFLFDVENANPNGDPINENRPRFDPDSETILVSDVRLKRTIRDYWFEYKGYNGSDGRDIFVRETKYINDGTEYIADGKRRASDFQDNRDIILDKCLDLRVFGGVLPLKKSSITFTGPVQFQMGRSINKTEIITEQGTGAFASGDKKQQATFRTEYKVPYAIIGFNGIINEKAAAHSKMTEEDMQLLLEGIWDGTKSLISRSKFGQSPLLLLSITYKEAYYTGNLRQSLSLRSEIDETKIRSTNDYSLNITALIDKLKQAGDKIDNVFLRIDPRLLLEYNGKAITLKTGDINLDEIS